MSRTALRVGGGLAALAVLGFLASSCGAPAAPAVAVCPRQDERHAAPERSPSDAGVDAASPHAPSLSVVLTPHMKPAPAVHVELVFSDPPGPTLTCTECIATNVLHLTASDAVGDLAASVSASGADTTVAFARASRGATRVAYDVVATSDLIAPPRAVLVADDRFRAFGESLLLLPASSPRMAITVAIDGSSLPAPIGASSLGIGASRTRSGRVDSLRSSAFLAGSLGTSVMDTGIEHDEAAWLGYTAFDPRPVTAEIAGVRSLLRETFQAEAEDHMVFFVSQSRAAASVLGRGSSAVAFVTPDEPWSAALRIAMTKHLVNRWIGGEARVLGADGRPAAWFGSGVALFYAAHALAHAGLLPPEDAREFVASLLAAQATLARTDASPADAFARQTAQGALYAARVSALLRARVERVASKGSGPAPSSHERKGQRLDDVLISLVEEARAHDGAALRSSAFIDAVAYVLGEDERRTFVSVIENGEPVVLPDDALGPCFAQRRARHTEMSLGFDLEQTLDAPDRTVKGLVPNGNAAKAGLLATDVLVSSNVAPGRADLPAKLTVQRGAEKQTLTFVPRGKEHAGFTFARTPGLTDAQCGKVL